jgi:hypothetical protein
MWRPTSTVRCPTTSAATIAAQEGVLWLGDRDNPDEDAVTQPVYADRLSMTLTDADT